jgi:hypothetical protein
MTSQEMMKTKCGKNQHFENIAKLGRKPNWVLRYYPLASSGVRPLY